MGHLGSTSTLNMGHMVNVLPDYRSPNYGTHSYQQAFPMQPTTNPSTIYPYQHNPQFSGQTRPPFDSSFAQQYPDAFLLNQQTRASHQNYTPPSGYQAPHVQGQQHFASQPYYQHQQQLVPNYSTSYTQSHQHYTGPNSSYNPYSQSYGARDDANRPQNQMRQGAGYLYGPAVQTGGEAPFTGTMPAGAPYAPPPPGPSKFLQSLFCVTKQSANFFGPPDLSRHSSDSSLRSSVPRGPPRKPKQSGHALWVGNLPPGTQIADLKDHFSRNATKEIESVFLISKSNCAFVNYKSETACAEAMTRFHDSRFQGVRLVCRLRRGSAATSSTSLVNPPSGAVPADGIEPKAPSTAGLIQQVGEPEQLDEKNVDGETTSTAPKVKEKFFVVKSLTVEDLDLSVRNGVWATQAHNEAALNKAYEVSVSIGFFPKN
jgi:RNA recognition motif-containing protein